MNESYPEQLLQDLRYALRNVCRKPGLQLSSSPHSRWVSVRIWRCSALSIRRRRGRPSPIPKSWLSCCRNTGVLARKRIRTARSSPVSTRDHAHVFSSLTGTSINHATLEWKQIHRRSRLLSVNRSWGTTSLLGLRPSLGRLIGPEDAKSSVAVLSWSFWNSRFGRDPAEYVVQSHRCERCAGGHHRRCPSRILWPACGNAQTDVWTPVKPPAGLNLIGRLEPGVTLEQARSEMNVLYRFTIEERVAASADPLVRNYTSSWSLPEPDSIVCVIR